MSCLSQSTGFEPEFRETATLYPPVGRVFEGIHQVDGECAATNGLQTADL
ncbi:MAG: hypothetical protein VX694_14505 [Planctomycetota bacterium]|nr:hypothetical protein [Planctomycetota bacterium]MEC7680479.1 hypothetical protein [Planctomycetota bacterium]